MDIDSLFTSMADAAAASGKALWEKAQGFAAPELKQVAARLVAIEIGVKDGTFSPEVAKQLMKMQVDSGVDVIIAMTELTVFEAQKLINAALEAVRDVANTAVGFKVI